MSFLLNKILFVIILYIKLNKSQNNSCSCVCGVRGRFNRIVGGQNSAPFEHPWTTSLLKNEILYCGATVVSKNFLITAAHCIYSFSPKEVSIYMGGNKILEDRSNLWNASQLIHHEKFDVVTFNNDIGFVRIVNSIIFGFNIQPACLLRSDGKQDYFGKLGTVTGWGRQGEQRATSEFLKYIVVPVWPEKKCWSSGYGRQRISSNMMCAGYEEGIYDACQGDSGGPLLMEQKSGSVAIIGIISWGRGCARQNFPGIYTKVENYKTWITKILSKECLCKEKSINQSKFQKF